MFINVGELGKAIDAVPFGSRVLEVGVGDGMIASQIVERRPDASVLGIDLAQNPGSLFEGDRSRVEFRTISTSDLLAEQPTPFDAIVIADVLHHVPPSLRTELLDDVAMERAYTLLKPLWLTSTVIKVSVGLINSSMSG